MKTPRLLPNALACSVALALPEIQATVIPFAEYHLGEPGSLEAGNNKPQDSSGNNRHFAADIHGGNATTGNASFHPAAAGSTAYLDASMPGDEGWFSSGVFTTLPTDNFAFGIFARAPSNAEANRGDIFTLGGDNGSFKLSLEGNGWAASSHNQAWLGNGGGTTGSFNANTWVHLAVIRSGGITTFYIDGVAQPGTYSGAPVHGAPHLVVKTGGQVYFDGHIDEARVVTFSPGETTPKILSALQQGVVPTSFVHVGAAGTFSTAALTTDEASSFRLGGSVLDSAIVTAPDGLSVVAGTAPKHLIHITQEGEIPIGTYTLIDYSGSIGGLGFPGFELAPLPGRISGHLVHNVANSSIDIEITGSEAGDVTWKGSGSGTWDVETSPNWVFTGSSVATRFFAGDVVLMDDSAAITSIVVAEPVTPSEVIIENNTKNYSFSGAGISGSSALGKYGSGKVTFTNSNDHSGPIQIEEGIIQIGDGGETGTLGTGATTNNGSLVVNRSGTIRMPNPISGSGTIEKQGSGRLILSGASSFSGAVTVSAGTLVSESPSCLGDVAGSTTVMAGATIDAFSGGFGSEPVIIHGNGVNGLGVVVNSAAAGNLNSFSNLTLGSDSTIGGTGRWDLRGTGATLSGNFKLTKIGSNQVSLVNALVTVKDIEITAGLLSLEAGTELDNSNPGTIAVTGGTLGFGEYGSAITCTKPIVLNGGVINTTGGGAAGNATVASAVSLQAAANTVNVQSAAVLTFTGTVSGSGDLVKTGPGTLALVAAPSYTGDTLVSGGVLTLTEPGLADTSAVDFSSGALLDLLFDGTDTVQALFIQGVQMPAGVYGFNHSSGLFSGNGTLTVTGGPAETPYVTWEADNGIAGAGGEADSDSDGIPNAIEFVIGGDPNGPDSDSSLLAPSVTKDGSYLNFVYRRTDASVSTGPLVEYSTALGDWITAKNGTNGVIIEVEDDFHGEGIDRVTVRIPVSLAVEAKLFARLLAEIF